MGSNEVYSNKRKVNFQKLMRYYKNNARSTFVDSSELKKALFVIHLVVKIILFQKKEHFLHKDGAGTIFQVVQYFI